MKKQLATLGLGVFGALLSTGIVPLNNVANINNQQAAHAYRSNEKPLFRYNPNSTVCLGWRWNKCVRRKYLKDLTQSEANTYCKSSAKLYYNIGLPKVPNPYGKLFAYTQLSGWTWFIPMRHHVWAHRSNRHCVLSRW